CQSNPSPMPCWQLATENWQLFVFSQTPHTARWCQCHAWRARLSEPESVRHARGRVIARAFPPVPAAWASSLPGGAETAWRTRRYPDEDNTSARCLLSRRGGRDEKE